MSPLVRRALLCCSLAVAFPAVVVGQTNYYTNGVEYSIAGSLAGDQTHPQLAIKTTGGYIVWDDNLTDGNGLGISARRLDGTLAGSLSPFRVNANGTNDQEKPQVVLLNNGGAAFFWQGGKRGSQHVYGRFMNSSNIWLTPSTDVLVNTVTNTWQADVDAATLANGNVVIVWGSYNQYSSSSQQDIYGQILSPTGSKVGGEFLINQFTSFNQRTPTVAALSDGRFVVSWVSEQQRADLAVDIYARLFTAAGAGSGGEILVDTSTNVCANPNVIGTASGGFIVAWSEKDLTSIRTNSWDVSARAFSSTGSAIGPVVAVNQYRFGDQFLPKLAINAHDVFIIWTSLGQDGSREGVFGRLFHDDLTANGNEFLINTTTAGPQIQPTVSGDGQSRFLVAWSSFIGVAAGQDLLAQRYATSAAPPPAPSPPIVSVLSSNSLMVSWPAVSGFAVSNYNVFMDGATTPIAVGTNTWYTMTGLNPVSTHWFQVDYVLADGRESLISGATTNTTYGTLTWGGIPYEWMTYYFGNDAFNWPSPYADSDGDGVSNLNEFLAGTNPTNSASALRTYPVATQQGMYVNWNTQPGLIYQVQSSTNLKTWTNLGGMRYAAGVADSIYVGGSPVGYYRVLRVR